MAKTFSELKAAGLIENIQTGSDAEKGDYITYEQKQFDPETGEALPNSSHMKLKSEIEAEKTVKQAEVDDDLDAILAEFTS